MSKAKNPIDKKLQEIKKTVDTEFELVEAELTFEKKPIEEILEASKNIDSAKVAKEVLTWLVENVPSFIDNHMRVFKLDLVLDEVEGLPETKKLQDLYRAMPEDEEVVDLINMSSDEIKALMSSPIEGAMKELIECVQTLDAVTDKAYQLMKEDEELLAELTKNMSYYYELKGIKDGELLIQEQDSRVDIFKFEYERFSMGVKILEGETAYNGDASHLPDKQVIKQYTVPEGFTVWIEISCKAKQRPSSMF